MFGLYLTGASLTGGSKTRILQECFCLWASLVLVGWVLCEVDFRWLIEEFAG